MTPQNLALATLIVSTISAFAFGFIQKRAGDRRARIARAFLVGVRTAIADYADRKDIAQEIEDGIYAAAADLQLDESHIEEHLDGGIAK